VEWVRRWQYELRWARGHTGVLNRTVDSLGQLRTVVEWARQNPYVEKYSFKPIDDLVGDRVAGCSQGHSLQAPPYWQASRRGRQMMLVRCRDCPGHYLTDCPTCSEPVFDPPLGPDCGPS
jgi:hypothetical protein